MGNEEKVIYSINIEDVQNVADERLDRHLNKEELKRVEDKIGNHIDWYGIISDIIDGMITSKIRPDYP